MPCLHQIQESWHDEQIMDALISAAQVIPSGPHDSAASAVAILARWRARANIGLATEEGEVLGSGAWEVGCVHFYSLPLVNTWLQTALHHVGAICTGHQALLPEEVNAGLGQQ